MNDRSPMTAALRIPRQNSRRQNVLDAAAGLFAERGYHGTSVRDIAAAAGLTPVAIYSHFASKADLLAAVYEEGVGRIAAALDAALARTSGPVRLQAACEAHLETLLEGGDYAQVVLRVWPRDVPEAQARLTRLRDGYEARFRRLVPDKHLRLLLLGAMNAAPAWYRPGGESPRVIARRFLERLAHG
jgi:TetR/AcrR family transcriptional regulator, cholesterol catabolism regulator